MLCCAERLALSACYQYIRYMEGRRGAWPALWQAQQAAANRRPGRSGY